ncbi:MAG: GNAT family N-acetyltransferase [Desulfosarcinaceae bacterium]|nr:GNAT family N-acetyltransferase [Desulfosarcinaceae bacterium]
MEIREACRAELPAILALYAQPAIDDGHYLDIARAEALFKEMGRHPAYHLFVATEADRIVGSFALLIMPNLGHLGKPSGVVESVVVAPERHRSGIGRAMMQFAMERCRARGCYKMTLSADLRRIDAHRFYESLGFERHGFSFVVPLERSPAAQ